MAASGNMADLPGDIVRCIAGRVAPECRQRMRAVCSAWSTAVLAEPLPWILLQTDNSDDDGTAAADSAERDCISSGGGFSVLSLPTDSKLPLSITCAGARCFGAGHGWLALIGSDLSVTLCNPITGNTVSLPPLTKHHPMVEADGHGEDGIGRWRSWFDLWTDSGGFDTGEEFRDDYIRKVVFSAQPRQDDYFAVVLSGSLSQHAMYARAGATSWKMLRDADGRRALSLVHDVVHVVDGVFLAVTRCHGKVLGFDLAVQGGTDDDDDVDDDDVDDDGYDDDDDYCYSPIVRILADPLVMTESLDYFVPGEDMHMENHLVLIDGELYQIWAAREAEPLPSEEQDSEKKLNRYRIADVGVVRYAPTAAGNWEAAVAADLGDWAVLVGRNETVAVCAGDVPGVSPSCVYFIAGELEEVVCAFQLRSGRAEPVGGDVLRHACATPLPPVWFLPSLK